MEMKKNKVSLDDFKKKMSANPATELSSISGGILGACHTVAVYYETIVYNGKVNVNVYVRYYNDEQ